jgi:hypothetical protein
MQPFGQRLGPTPGCRQRTQQILSWCRRRHLAQYALRPMPPAAGVDLGAPRPLGLGASASTRQGIYIVAALSRCCAVKHNMNTKRSSTLQVETTAQDVCMRCLLEDETLEAETQRVKSRASRHLVIEHNTISSWRHGIMACVVCQHAQMLHFMLRRAAGLVSLGWADANVMAVHHHNRKRWRRHCHLCGHGFNGGT